ncbi:histidine kinase [Chryseobacterium camelliae]|uniref:Histidine kinase n=1 Tax=Chryseobacterium camelliae TaxID=1265445 RepID=A0ABY7QQT8_9FLAO|nr:histidine kinase [Chryseobacterium camelliae]WBV61091.1 histidine kinase [Chryseobacterium camelliae]
MNPPKKEKISNKISILLFILFFSPLYICQIPGLINYNESDGLNCSYTYRMNQDYNGFMWIGTDNGLFRFDGKEFKQYGRKEGLKNIDVITCAPLPNGEIFIVPFLNDFTYLKNGKIINSTLNKYLANPFSNYVPVITQHENTLYLHSLRDPKEIFIYKNEQLKKYPIFIDYKDRFLRAFKFDYHTNTLYLKGDLEDYIIAYNIISRKQEIIPGIKGYPIYDKNNLLVFYDKKKLDVYQFQGTTHIKKTHSYPLTGVIINSIIDKNNKLWLNMNNGGALYFNQSLLDESKPLAPPISLLKDQVIHYVFVDKDDNVWFSLRNKGISFISKAFFANYINLPLKNNSEYIKTINQNADHIVVGYDRAAGAIYKNGKLKEIVLDPTDKTESRALYINKNILLFGLSSKFILYNTSNNKSCASNIGSLIGGGPKNIVPYTDNSILVCNSAGLIIYNADSKKADYIFTKRTYNALPYTRDSIFVGDFSNLYKLSVKTKKNVLFLKGYYFTDLKKLKDNLYVGATNTNGIIIFNNKKVLQKISESNGLLSNQVKRIDIETADLFWASTNYGISRVNLTGKKLKINNFTQIDGLPSNVVAGSVIKNDSIFIGTSKGLGIFSIKKLLSQEKLINRKVIVNSVKIGNQEYFDLNRELAGHTPDDVVFNLSFLDYASQGKISYRYKVEGLSNEWQVSNSSRIILNSIPPGKYVLKVFGLDYNGKQSYTSTDLAFEIKPHFWQTWWFTLLLIFLLLGILFTAINFYFRKKRNKKLETLQYEKKIAELELQAIKAQINPHFIYNCLNSIQYLLYKKDYRETENYLDTFSQMIRKTLHYSEKTFMPIQEETEYLSLYLEMEKLRLKDLFDYKISLSEKVNPNWVIPSLLIQPFVENAIKHGIPNLKDRKGCIEIYFDHSDSALIISIEDNGVGIGNLPKSTTKANSFGVKLSQKRIETFKQLFETHIILEITDLSGQNKQGTLIKLYITPYENKNTGLHH